MMRFPSNGWPYYLLVTTSATIDATSCDCLVLINCLIYVFTFEKRIANYISTTSYLKAKLVFSSSKFKIAFDFILLLFIISI